MYGHLLVKAGHHSRACCLCEASLPASLHLDDAVHGVDAEGEAMSCQVVASGRGLLLGLPSLPRDCETVIRLESGAFPGPALVVRAGSEPGSYDICQGNSLFATLHTDDRWAKPFLYPVCNGRQARVTRGFPMENLAGETQDHPHQKSFWTGWGEVNGCDLWGEEPGHGRMVTKAVDILENGPLRVRLRLQVDWVTATGDNLLAEERTLSFCCLGDSRWIDLDTRLSAAYGPVHWGDTKEGGFCSVRVASSMDGVCGGMITLADGSQGEGECWGKRSCWCDYYGAVAGGKAGICLMEHPENLDAPTRWHVRDYGLMAANPFGLSHFVGASRNGSYDLASGGSLRWRYRVFLHVDDCEQARLHDRYQDYIHGPVCSYLG